jgi:tripartite-type tricarboxylate transporter receptor subunit TctC
MTICFERHFDGFSLHLYKSLPYDPVKDFEPIARVGTLAFMLVVNPELPVGNTREFISYAVAHPGQLSFGTASTASLVGAETINAMAHAEMVAVGYKASPQAILGLFAPAGTPQPIVARLAHETLASLAQSDVKDRLAAIGFEVEPLDTVAFGRYVREQLDTWGKLIRAAKIQPE